MIEIPLSELQIRGMTRNELLNTIGDVWEGQQQMMAQYSRLTLELAKRDAIEAGKQEAKK
jgi:hypothetical protein